MSVCGLARVSTVETVRNHFGKADVLKVWFQPNIAINKHKAVVVFASVAAATKALDMHGSALHGRTLNVTLHRV